MEIALVLFAAVISAVIAWLPCGVGLAAHRFALAGAEIRSKNEFIVFLSRPPKSYPPLTRFFFTVAMISWCAVFFFLLGATSFVAEQVGLAESHPVIPYALTLHVCVAILSVISGNFLWRKLAYDL